MKGQRRKWKWEARRKRLHVGMMDWWRQGGDRRRWEWKMGKWRLEVIMLDWWGAEVERGCRRGCWRRRH